MHSKTRFGFGFLVLFLNTFLNSGIQNSIQNKTNSKQKLTLSQPEGTLCGTK